jgi:hypothetical protein
MDGYAEIESDTALLREGGRGKGYKDPDSFATWFDVAR